MSDCICKGNWRLIIKEYEHLIGREYLDDNENINTFFGVVHGGDDYYYGMQAADGNLRLLSCVGDIEAFGFELITQG